MGKQRCANTECSQICSGALRLKAQRQQLRANEPERLQNMIQATIQCDGCGDRLQVQIRSDANWEIGLALHKHRWVATEKHQHCDRCNEKQVQISLRAESVLER